MPSANRTVHPLFEKFTVEELMRRTPYSEIYLVSIKTGQHPARPRFKATMSSILGIPEAELFGEPATEAA